MAITIQISKDKKRAQYKRDTGKKGMLPFGE